METEQEPKYDFNNLGQRIKTRLWLLLTTRNYVAMMGIKR